MMTRRQITGRYLILALVLSSQFGLQLTAPVASLGAVNSGLGQDTNIYLPFVSKACTNCYYVDSINGSDANLGTTEGLPWRTLTPVHAENFLPGDVVLFKRGSSWMGRLVVGNSGTPSNPITFTTYGIGDRPIIRNPGGPGNLTDAVLIEANWVIVEGLLVRDAQAAGVLIPQGWGHNVVRDIEATNAGLGIYVNGQNNLVTRNYIHDLHMVVNTPGGNDDYGAVGVGLGNNASFNEVSYNRIINCIASSYDFGTDGGAVEWWGSTDSNYVHHNWAAANKGFFEVGGGSAKNTTVAYNVSVNNGQFSSFHVSGPFASQVENFRVENNTIAESASAGQHWVIFGFDGDPTENALTVRNNIIYVDGFSAVSNTSSFAHDHNLFYLGGGTGLGFTLGLGDQITDPLFVNLPGQDFHLQPLSPAINAGVNLGYTLDFEDRPVPVGAAPDLGAFEYQGAP